MEVMVVKIGQNRVCSNHLESFSCIGINLISPLMYVHTDELVVPKSIPIVMCIPFL